MVMETASSGASYFHLVKNVITELKKTAVGYNYENYNQFCEFINQENKLNSLAIQLSY
jgi:hypothetical protein